MRDQLETSVCLILVLALIHVAVSSTLAHAELAPANGHASSTNVMAVPVKIAPGDLLEITVFDVPELTQQVRIGADGKAQLALIGDTALAGLTGQEAAETIAHELRERNFLLRPQVNVLVKEFASQ